MPGKTNIAVVLLLLFYTSLHAQESHSAQPAQPTSSVYNRMRRIPAPQNGGQQQARQFPDPAQQFPPDQRMGPVPMQAPSSSNQQPVSQPQMNQPQNGPYTGMVPGAGVQQSTSPSASAGPAQPQAPYGLALQPPNPPKISYANGELTIVANNSSLADIVSGVERATGVRVEGTRPDAERVFGQFGPGAPRDVLNSLFDGSRYDFILVGSLASPADVQTITLSPHGTALASGGAPAGAQPPRQTEESEEQDNDSTVVQQGGEAIPPGNFPREQAPPTPPPPPAQQQQQQVKTPEQLLQELQRLRQQQQQQTQQSQTPR